MKPEVKELCSACIEGDLIEIQKIVQMSSKLTSNDFIEPTVYTINNKGTIENKIQILKYFKSQGADFNFRDGEILEWVVKLDNTELLTFLLEEGLDIKLDGGMSIYYAACNNHPNILTSLINEGAEAGSDVINELHSCNLSGEINQILVNEIESF